jgi:leucyl-tRNA synthetase
MAVPAHDERDKEFAQVYNLPTKEIELQDKEEITKKFGKKVTKYKLKNWVFSRQRYWGEPIPVFHKPDGTIEGVAEKDLPVELPMVKSYEPTGTGESPLAAISKWVNVPHSAKASRGKEIWKRETNTMPQWAGSSWYYLRYMDSKNKKNLVDADKEKYWNQADLYVGGAEHATRHLIYARFWHKFLFDIGVVSTTEPFKKLQSVGLIMAEDGRKMSKRWGNVVNPDDIIKTYGADTMRVYEMFMGPFNQAIAWNTQSMIGSRRFIERLWNIQEKIAGKKDKAVLPNDAEVLLNQTIKKVTEDIGSLNFNTAISALMILLNRLEKEVKVGAETFGIVLKLIAPFAPHIADEMWKNIGGKGSIHTAQWPVYDGNKIQSNEVTIAIQVNGKMRGSIVCTRGISQEEVIRLAKQEENVKKWTEGKNIRKEIYVEGKLVSLVID